MNRRQSVKTSEVMGALVLRLPDAVRAWGWLAFLSACALVLYVGQFEETNAYIGIFPIHELGEFGYWLMMGLWLFIMALLFPMRVRRPSDIFLCLYLLGVALWSASYWPATGLIDLAQAMFLGCVLLLPALLVAAGRWFCLHVSVRVPHLPIRFSRSYLMPTLILLLGVASLLGYRIAGDDVGFSLEEGNIRRLAGRESFSGNVFAAYLMQMSVNGIAPFLAYLGMQRRSLWALAFAFGFAIFSFWLLALKSPTLNVTVLAALGYLVRSGRIVNFSRWLIMALATVLFVSIMELWLFDLSLIADYGIRRVILVSSTIQAYFSDVLFHLGTWQLLFNGVSLADYASPEHLVGAIYMGNPLTNANTNAYLHQAALSGFVGYALVVAGTVLFMIVLDLLHASGRTTDGFAISAMTARCWLNRHLVLRWLVQDYCFVSSCRLLFPVQFESV